MGNRDVIQELEARKLREERDATAARAGDNDHDKCRRHYRQRCYRNASARLHHPRERIVRDFIDHELDLWRFAVRAEHVHRAICEAKNNKACASEGLVSEMWCAASVPDDRSAEHMARATAEVAVYQSLAETSIPRSRHNAALSMSRPVPHQCLPNQGKGRTEKRRQRIRCSTSARRRRDTSTTSTPLRPRRGELYRSKATTPQREQ